MTRVKGYAPWRPQTKTLAILEQIRAVFVEYRDYLPMTCRQVFYRLVGQFGYDKDERAYNRLCEYLVRARRAGTFPFDWIRDDGTVGGPPAHYRDAEEFWDAVRADAERFQLDALSDEPVHVEILCEAAGMVPQLQRIAYPLSVPVYSAGGFDSLTVKRELVNRILDADRAAGPGQQRPSVILQLGDWDPSGKSIFDALAEDVREFLFDDAMWLADEVEFRRVALTPEQIDSFSLPTAPPKRSDSRSRSWIGGTVQLEALAPDLLDRIVREELESVLDMDLVARKSEESLELRAEILGRLNGNGRPT